MMLCWVTSFPSSYIQSRSRMSTMSHFL